MLEGGDRAKGGHEVVMERWKRREGKKSQGRLIREEGERKRVPEKTENAGKKRA